jgi:hypothetical protein
VALRSPRFRQLSLTMGTSSASGKGRPPTNKPDRRTHVGEDGHRPRFRDGKSWPESIIDGEGRGEELGYKAVNGRTSWDAGVVYGYGTDTTYDPKAGLEHELKCLYLMFSMRDIIQLMGPNTAAYIQMSDQLGTLEEGKMADLALLDGNPLEGFWKYA